MRQRIGWLLAGLGLGALLWNVAPALAQLSVSGNLFDMTDRAARAVGRVFMRNPGDTANMGDATTPVRTDPTGATTQPVSAASLPLPAGAATETTLGTRAADVTITNRLPAGSTPADNESNAITTSRLGAWLWIFDGTTWDRWTGAVTATDLDIRNLVAATDKIDVGQINGVAPSMGNGISGTGVQRVTLASDGTGVVKPWDGTNTVTVKAASTAPATTDTSLVVAQSPTPAPVCTSIIAINQTTSTTVIAGVASQKIFICSIVLISATAQSISVTTGTGTVCATGEDAVIGGTTASLALAANGGFVVAAGTPWIVTQDAADGLCVEQSGAGNVSGVITYKQQVP